MGLGWGRGLRSKIGRLGVVGIIDEESAIVTIVENEKIRCKCKTLILIMKMHNVLNCLTDSIKII